MRQNGIFLAFFEKMLGGRAEGLAHVFFKSLAGKNFVFGHMAEKLKRPTGTRTG
jgi:hypothetical protein